MIKKQSSKKSMAVQFLTGKAHQKATENSETGKVTAIVAVMKIFSNKIVNSRNSMSGKTEIKPKHG